MFKFNLIIFFLFSLLRFTAQDFKKDMIALSNKMLKAKSISYKLHYNMYLDYDFTAPYQQRDIKLVKSSPYNLVCSDGSNEFVFNKDARLLVNHKYKRIIITPQSNKNFRQNEILNFIETGFDTLMMAYDKVNSKKISDDVVEYECRMKAGIYLKIIIQYNTKKCILEKATFYHKAPIKKIEKDTKTHPVVLELIYKDFDFNPKMSEDLFSQKKYLKMEENKYVLVSAFSSYSFINLFDNNYEFKN